MSSPGEVHAADARWWPWFAVGLGGALVWFAYVSSVGLPNRVRGDAVAYLRIAAGAEGLGDLLTYAGPRTLGFPLFLWLVRVPFELVEPLSDASLGAFVAVVSVILLVVHVAASSLFFGAMRRVLLSALRVTLHPAALALVIAYPSLVAHTTVPLTDTLGADLLMVGVALWVTPRSARVAVHRVLAGIVLGVLVLVRPSALPVVAVAMMAGIVQAAWGARTDLPGALLAAALCAVVVGWQASTCAAAFGRICLVEPAGGRRALAESVAWGSVSARHYWSRHSQDEEGRVILRDPLLARLVGERCRPENLKDILACVIANPAAVPVLMLEKSIGLFDAYHLQPYAVDVTPRWARWLGRGTGAVAFAGFAAVVGWLFLVPRLARPFPSLLVLVVPAVHVAWHALFHVEGRYGLPAVPFALVVLVATVQWAWRRPRVSRQAVLLALVFAGAAFLAQTSVWDASDRVLHRIEAY